MALGARASSVRLMIIRENLAPVVAGLLGGGVVAWWMTRFVATFLYGVSEHDPRVRALSACFIVAAAVAAAWFPARRASRLDPLLVLRAE